MSSPVNAIEAASSGPAVSAGALAVKLWPCAADATEVVPKMKKMKAMTNHLLHNPIWIFTAYNLPFLSRSSPACLPSEQSVTLEVSSVRAKVQQLSRSRESLVQARLA